MEKSNNNYTCSLDGLHNIPALNECRNPDPDPEDRELIRLDFRAYSAGASIFVNGKKTDIRKSLGLAYHSPTGYAWGYLGSGPAQAALSICLEITDSEKEALSIYQNFKSDIIARLPFGSSCTVWIERDERERCKYKPVTLKPEEIEREYTKTKEAENE